MTIEINGTEYLSVTEVADKVGVSRQTLWRWRRTGNIPSGSKYRGKQVLYTLDELELIQKFSERIEPINIQVYVVKWFRTFLLIS